MKPIKFKLTICAALFAAVSCTNLDVDIKSQYTEYPDSDLAAEAVTANVYYAMRGPLSRDYNHAHSLSSDETVGVSMGADYYDGGRYMNMCIHSWTPDDPCIGYWSDVMGGITKANEALVLFSDPDSENSAHVRAARAYYYWVLMDGYGDVPIIEGPIDEGTAINRSKRADVARFIEAELLAVMDKLTTTVDATTYGKPTRYMAQALLAKLYLNWALYTADDVKNYTPSMNNEKLNELVAACDDIIQSGQFNLSNSYKEKFLPNNGAHIKDFIYAMPFDRVTQRGMTYARFWSHRSAQQVFYGVNLAQSLGGNFRVLPEFHDKFNLAGDERNNQFLTGLQYIRDAKTYEATTTPWEVSGVHVELTREIEIINEATLDTGNDLKGRSQGYRSIKFYMDLESTSADSRSQSNDVPIFRYADVLLMKAEAILRGATSTNGDTPASLMNQIRSYVKAPAVTGTPTLDELLDERAREFADESWRRNDLIRFGKFEDSWGYKYLNPNAGEKYLRVFPLPRDVVNTNTNWSQNEGYI